MLLLAFAIFANVEHRQAAKRAAADIEGHSAAPRTRPAATIERVEGFASECDAGRWIRNDSIEGLMIWHQLIPVAALAIFALLVGGLILRPRHN